MRRIIKQFIFLIILLLSISGVVVFLFNTEMALRGMVTVATKVIPGKLTIEKTAGHLNNFTLKGVNYKNAAVDLTINQVQFSWSVSHLLQGVFRINCLNLDGIKIQTFAADKVQTSAKLPAKKIRAWLGHLQWLSHIRCYNVKITDVLWQTPNEKTPLKIDDFTFQLQDDGHLNSALHALTTTLLVQGEVGNQLNVTWKFSLPHLESLVHAAGSIYSEGVVSGTGDLPKINGVITVTHLITDEVNLGRFSSKFNLDWEKRNSELNFSLQRFKTSGIEIPAWQGKWLFQVNDGIKLTLASVPLVIHSFLGNQFHVLSVDDLGATVDWNADKIELNGNFVLEHNPFAVSLALTKRHLALWNLSKAALLGKLTWQVNDLSFISGFFPQLARVHGAAKINYDFKGTLLQPEITGQLVVANTAFTVPKLGLSLHDLQLSLKQDHTNLSYDGAVRSGTGDLQFKGAAQFNDDPTFTVDVTGKDFLVSNTPEYVITVTPKLRIYFENNSLHIDGSILIPKASIKPVDLSSNATLPREVVFVGQRTSDNLLERLQLYSKVQLELGDAVKIDAFNVKGRLYGAIEITDEPNRPTTANGSLTVSKGTYSMYGQTLKITQGELHFAASPIDNPELNMRATRTLVAVNLPDTMGFGQKNDLVVGLQTSGTIDSLQIELFSVPSGLSKTDIFSYLILGQPEAQATSNKAQLLLQAATALNFSGVSELNHVIDNLRETFGLNKLALTSEETSQINSSGDAAMPTSNTALVLGKFLSPRLYVSYSIGFLEQVNIFRARYRLSKHWSAQTENSTLGNGVDLIYSVERK